MPASPPDLRAVPTANRHDPDAPSWTCPRCFGEGWYSYDDNHAKPCELCCPHDQGFWQLPAEGYGDRGGWWNCRAGCGHTVPEQPENVEPAPGATSHRLRVGDRVRHQWPRAD